MENKIWNAVEGFDPNDSLICYRKTEKNADGTARLMDTLYMPLRAMLMKTGLLCAASGSTMTRSCRWRISTLDTPPLTSSNCAQQRKNTAPRKMNSCQVVRTG